MNGQDAPQEPIIHDPSSPIEKIVEKAAHVAKFVKHPVFISGETGTGKEGIARLIHDKSGLSSFLPINCASLATDIAGSEFFGHEKGAFTGAFNKRAGIFEYANSGTIFLDEITEMPLELQAQLLRVLENREIRPVGSNQILAFKGRVIAATNRNPEEAIKEGKLRKDLYHRLTAGSIIELPPLRERKMDIPLLARYFAQQAVAPYEEEGFIAPPISPEAMQLLMDYDWKGNIRTKGVITRATQDAQNVASDAEVIITPEIVKEELRVTGHIIANTEAAIIPAAPETFDVSPEVTNSIIASQKKLRKLFINEKHDQVNVNALARDTDVSRTALRHLLSNDNPTIPSTAVINKLIAYCKKKSTETEKEFHTSLSELELALNPDTTPEIQPIITVKRKLYDLFISPDTSHVYYDKIAAETHLGIGTIKRFLRANYTYLPDSLTEHKLQKYCEKRDNGEQFKTLLKELRDAVSVYRMAMETSTDDKIPAPSHVSKIKRYNGAKPASHVDKITETQSLNGKHRPIQEIKTDFATLFAGNGKKLNINEIVRDSGASFTAVQHWLTGDSQRAPQRQVTEALRSFCKTKDKEAKFDALHQELVDSIQFHHGRGGKQ